MEQVSSSLTKVLGLNPPWACNNVKILRKGFAHLGLTILEGLISAVACG